MAPDDDHYLRNLDHTLRELQRVVKEQEYALSQLRISSHGSHRSGEPQSATASLELMTSAHEAATNSTPFLPSHGSVLPALLALRKTHETTSESSAYAASHRVFTEEAGRQLEVEKANLEDQRALQRALESRIETLRNGLDTSHKRTADQVAEEKLDELKKLKANYDKETSRLLQFLNRFIDQHLGAMLAAEELAGPVVGDMMDVDTNDLSSGFNAQGKPKKTKVAPDEGMRQRRIDDIWGAGDGHRIRSGRAIDEDDEASAAGAEMRELTELLLNSLLDSGGDTSAAYVQVPRETAAARFLVRSRVAQLDPKDATRLRLVDFGRDLDE